MNAIKSLAPVVAGSLLVFSMAAGAATSPAPVMATGAAHQADGAKATACKEIKDAKERQKCRHEAAKAAKEHKAAGAASQ